MTTGGPRTLPAGAAYTLWAPTYDDETAVSALDRDAVAALSPPLSGERLLEAGCGTARRLAEARSLGAEAFGVDLVEAMLRRGAQAGRGSGVAAADVRALPFTSGGFDVVWCRLVLGHVPELAAAYVELARMLRPGGTLVVTDFHPAAAHAGHTRSFRDRKGVRHAVEHHVHDLDAHRCAASAAGLTFERHVEREVGPAVRSFYDAAAAGARYEADLGLPLVLAAAFRG